MLATSDDRSMDLFGPVPTAPAVDQAVDDSKPDQPRAPRAKRALKSALTASSVDPKVAMSFAFRELFPELIAMQATACAAKAVTPVLADANLSMDGALPDSMTIPDDEDSPSFEAGPRSTVTDEQLREEQRAWVASDLTDSLAADFMWRLQVAHLEENLMFLFSVDTKSRVTMEKGHILQWVFTDDVVGPLDFRDNHLSFHRCCKAYGIQDPDQFRRMLLNVPLVRDLLVSLHLYRDSDLPKMRRVVTYADIVGSDRAVPDNQTCQFAGM